MKRTWLIIGSFAAITVFGFYSGPRPLISPGSAIAATLINQISDFSDLIQQHFEPAVQGNLPVHELQKLFLDTRLAYKRFEWAAEYFDPAAAKLLNGAPISEAEPVSEGGPGRFRVQEPQGLQVIEALLFPRYDTTRKAELLERLRRLRSDCQRYKVHFGNIDLLDGQVFDAAKLEVFRVLTLGITGFDAPLSPNCLNESATSIEGLQGILAHYASSDDPGGLIASFAQAAANLRQHPAFDSFDRARFITQFGNPLTIGLTHLQQNLHIPVIRYNRLLRQDAETIFDATAFDPDAYAPAEDGISSPEKIALGKKLFSDPMLSGDGKRSCASCHRPDMAFSDGLMRNTVIGSHDLLARNTPTLLNAALQPAFFYDLRVANLEEQVRTVLADSLEMQSGVRSAAARLWADGGYRTLFASAFPGSDRARFDTLDLMNALAAYVRSLVRLNSRFDDYMRGNLHALNEQEVRGFNLFMGKAKCATCHYMPLFNGVFPPRYVRMETEVIGVPAALDTGRIDEDPGRFAIDPEPFLQHAFKTPTVRNAARTAPYMHNGIFATLEQVIDFYNNGGAASLRGKVTNQTLSADSLHLTPVEKEALIGFVKSLDSQ